MTPILKRTTVIATTLVSALFFAACVSTPQMNAEDNASWGPDPLDPANSAMPTGVPAAPAGLAQDRRLLELKEQRRAFLVDEHTKRAQTLRDRLRLRDSRDQLLAALSLDPDHLQAKKDLAEVNALLGENYNSKVTTVTETLQSQTRVKTAQMRAEARDLLREGKLMLVKGDYDGAIAQLTIAQQTVRFAPYSIDWDGLDTEVNELLSDAKSKRSTVAEASLLEQQRSAFDALQTREEAAVNRRRLVVDNMVTQAIDSFDAGNYEDTIYFADQALRKDPRNQQAEELRSSAFKAGLKQTRVRYVAKKREQFKRWKEELESYKIAWSDTITLPDPEAWAEMTELRSKRRGLNLEQTRSLADITLRKNLASTLIAMPEVDEVESLRELVDLIRLMTGLPLVVDPAAENAVLDEGILFTFSFENDLTVEQTLNLLTDMAGEQVTWIVRHDAVLVTTKEKARGEPIVVHHDVQDLVFGLTEFIGPRINRIRLLDELEDDDGGGPFGFVGEQAHLINIDDLGTLIQENVEPGSWDDARIEPYEGHIIVVQTPEVQKKVTAFLEDLRSFSSSMVTIETKFMTVGDNWIQEIGVDFRGLDNNPLTDVTNGLEDMASRGLDNSGTGSDGSNAAGAPSSGFFYDDEGDGDFRGRTENYFDNSLGRSLSTIGGMTLQYSLLNDLELSAILRAVEKSETLTMINDQVLAVQNTQRAYVTILTQRAYIQDFDVEVATFQAVADPQVNVLSEGVVLDVRPTIHHNRRYVTLEVQPTVAKVVNVRRYSTTLGGNTSPVEFELPELEVQSVFTTAEIPDGGSILLGGLTDIRNVERRAEVPWLAKVPLVGFFFKSEGYSDENKSLIILIKATITDVREEVKKIEAAY
ncbi:MAG: tetratricopeptide (TPR) repeat protein [Candidatus Paceibacteria bacterium]|jgi:tetratricopeptide (TPR) repeat protein